MLTLWSTRENEATTTNFTSAVLPEIQLKSEFIFDENDTITVQAGEESQLDCIVDGARPQPAVLWKIGNPIRNQFDY